MTRVRTWLEYGEITNILSTNPKLEAMEREIMEQKLSEIKAQFITDFGVEGEFEIKAVQTRPGQDRNRLSYRIISASKRTTVLLKKQPGWLERFIR